VAEIRKNPVKVKAGTIGARTRWGPLRVVRLDELTPNQRNLVLTLIREMGGRDAKAPPTEPPEAATDPAA
jgi:hypothetical protein